MNFSHHWTCISKCGCFQKIWNQIFLHYYSKFCDWSYLPECSTPSLMVEQFTMSHLIFQIMLFQQVCDWSFLPECSTYRLYYCSKIRDWSSMPEYTPSVLKENKHYEPYNSQDYVVSKSVTGNLYQSKSRLFI